MTCGVVVSCYNNWDTIRRCLAALAAQTRRPDVVVLADDGSLPPSDPSIFRQPFGSLIHVWHPDAGNTKPAMLNRAVAQLETDVVLFVDGDCLAHRRFVEDHLALLRGNPGRYVQGSRAEILRAWTSGFDPDFPTVFRYAAAGKITSRIKAFRFPKLLRRWVWGGPYYPCGSNISLRRQDFIRVNGYDERFSGFGNEDNDFCYRLQGAGVMPVMAPGSCILYHLGHPLLARSESNAAQLAEKLKAGDMGSHPGFEGTCERAPAPVVRRYPGNPAQK